MVKGKTKLFKPFRKCYIVTSSDQLIFYCLDVDNHQTITVETVLIKLSPCQLSAHQYNFKKKSSQGLGLIRLIEVQSKTVHMHFFFNLLLYKVAKQ